MKLKLVLDNVFPGLYHLKNGEISIAMIFDDNGQYEIGFMVYRFKIDELYEIYEFVKSETKLLTRHLN